MTITADEIYLLNHMNSVAEKTQLGTLIQNAESVLAAEIALADGSVLIGNSSGVAQARVVSGDITISNAGVVAIGADKILNSMIADAQVSLEHLDAGIAPSHVVKFAGEFTTAGGDTDETIAVSGVVDTDLVVVTVQTAGGSPVTVVDAAAGTDQIDVDMSADPSNDHVLTYVVYRAAS